MRREHIWKKAVDWIAKSDSRVRIESQMIAGEQFDVWKWIQVDSPATEVKCVYVLNILVFTVEPLLKNPPNLH